LFAGHGHLLRSRNPFQHNQRSIALRRSVGLEHLGVYDQSAAVHHQKNVIERRELAGVVVLAVVGVVLVAPAPAKQPVEKASAVVA